MVLHLSRGNSVFGAASRYTLRVVAKASGFLPNAFDGTVVWSRSVVCWHGTHSCVNVGSILEAGVGRRHLVSTMLWTCFFFSIGLRSVMKAKFQFVHKDTFPGPV